MALSIIFVKVFCIKGVYKKILLDYCVNSRVCNYGRGHDRTPTDCNYSFSFHISYFNKNEWVPMKGRMKVVPSNSVSIGSWYRPCTKT